MRRLRHLLLVGLLPAIVGCASGGSAVSDDAGQANGRVVFGLLKCKYREGTNIVIRSDRTFACRLKAARGGWSELYRADVSKVGIDLLYFEDKTMNWVVLAPAFSNKAGVLEGNYVGVSADAAFGLGVAGDILLGGSNDSIALQPAVTSHSTGFGAAIGFKSLSLTYEGPGR